MPLFGRWLVDSAAQAVCLFAVLSKPDASENQAAAAASLVATNCLNVWFGIEFFNAVG
jgi:hypothetical protein